MENLTKWKDLWFGRQDTEYRESFLAEDIEQSRDIIAIVTLVVAVFVLVDYQFFGFGELFFASLLARAVFCLISLSIHSKMKRHKRSGANDLAILAWTSLLAILTLSFNFTRPSDFNDNLLLHGAMILGSYTLLPNRILFKAIPAAAFTITDLAILIFVRPMLSPAAITISLVAFITLNIIGIMTAVRNENFRRRYYYAEKLDDYNRQKLEELATTDSLTGLLSRRRFIEFGEFELRHYKRMGKKFAFAVLDLNNFKSINDQYGHPAGDTVLKQFCSALSSAKRQIDILGRLGGDEVGVLMPETSAKEAAILIRRFRNIMRSRAMELAGRKIYITFCAGITVAHASDKSLDDVYRRADKHLYTAKHRFGKRHRKSRGN